MAKIDKMEVEIGVKPGVSLLAPPEPQQPQLQEWLTEHIDMSLFAVDDDLVEGEQCLPWIRELRGRRKKFLDAMHPIKNAWHQGHKAVVAFEKAHIEALDKAIDKLMGAITDHFIKQREQQLLVQDKMLSNAKKDRQKEVLKLLKEGKKDEAKELMQKEVTALEIAPPPMPEGVHWVTRWYGQCEDLKALVKAAATDDYFLQFIAANVYSLNDQARKTKEAGDMPPGCVAVPVTSLEVK